MRTLGPIPAMQYARRAQGRVAAEGRERTLVRGGVQAVNHGREAGGYDWT
jgi:hypothetical protein